MPETALFYGREKESRQTAKMHMREAWKMWRYLGYDRETIARYRAQTNHSNLTALQHTCIMALVILAGMSVFFGVLMREPLKMWVCIGTFVFILTILIHVRAMLTGRQRSKLQGTNALICAVSVAVYGLGVYSGIVLLGGELAVVIIWLFLLVQISFNLPPLQNALTVLPAAGLFMALSYSFKPAPKCYYDIALSAVSVLAGLVVSYHQTKLALDNTIAKTHLTQVNFALYHTCTTDELTGLSNRRMVFERYDELLLVCEETGCDLACIVLDIDDYKQFNDTYGHPEGDELLRRIGETLSAYGREHNVEIGRIGGEEFLVIWPEASEERCQRVAEELRAAIERMEVPLEGAAGRLRVTMSVGFCVLPLQLAEKAYFFADKALYRAKDAGKNCSCRYDADSGAYCMVRGADEAADGAQNRA